jgi:WD40 repeat protein
MRGTAVSFSPDGNSMAVGWYGGRLELWDVPGRRWVRTLTKGEHLRHQGRAVFSPAQNLLAGVPDESHVILYDLDSGREANVWRAPNDGLWDVRDLSFSTDGSKLVIYAGSYQQFGDAVWVVNVSSAKTEGRYPAVWSNSELHGAARISPDNARLFLSQSDSVNYRYTIRCLDLGTGQQVWETDPERDYGLTTLAISPDGRWLASGSGFEDPAIRVWDAASGKFLHRLRRERSNDPVLVYHSVDRNQSAARPQ